MQAGNDEARFVWRNLDAFLAGELSPQDAARVGALLGKSPGAPDFAHSHQQFSDVVRRSMNESPVSCPDGLREKVLAALDRCEADSEFAPAPPFPWLGASLLAAASLLVAVGLFYAFGNQELEPGLSARLVPMVSVATLDVPRSEKCRYRLAVEEYRAHFPDGPDIPRHLDGHKCRVSDFHCDDIDGRRVMCTVFDSPGGDRFAVMIFKGECLGRSAPETLRAAELEMENKFVMWWREGKYVIALVAKSGDEALRRRLEQMRAAVNS